MVTASDPEPEPELHKVKITFWKGQVFTVDNGPPRGGNAPSAEDIAFIESIKKSQVPAEIGRDCQVELQDKHDEEYKVQPTVFKSFTGGGRRLGDVVPNVVTEATGVASATSSIPASTISAPKATVQVDGSQPVTKIQLRLMDGTRMRAQFNLTQTIGDVRAFVDAAQSGAARPYVLMTTFPNKILSDLSQTVEAAGLKGAQVVQKPA
jgi:UBX domain-containing protein 1